jgi:molybdopterin converting factor small subunit
MGPHVELFGIPRIRAGTAATNACGDSLGAVVAELSRRFPELAHSCFDCGRLRPGYLASLNGDRFVTDPATPISADDCLLILSADAGG